MRLSPAAGACRPAHRTSAAEASAAEASSTARRSAPRTASARRRWLGLCAAVLGTIGATAAQGPIAVRAGVVHTITKGTLEDVVILIEDGVITAIGSDVEPSWQAQVIDASDKVVMPTYVLAHTSSGLSGANENMPNVPYLTVQDSVDPSSIFFEEALRNGIGTIHVIPGNSTLIGGLGMVVRPTGRTVEDMAVRTKGGMKLSLHAEGSRMQQIRKLHRAFSDAQRYQQDYERRKAELEQEKAAGAVPADKEWDEEIDAKQQPVLDLLAGKHTAFLYVPSAAEVAEAVRIANRYGFPTVLVLGPTCFKAARQLAGLQQPVVLDEALEVWETDPETEEETVHCPAAELAKLGIPFALSAGDGGGASRRSGGLPGGAERYPWWQMATAVRHGVSRQQALESLTIVPARLLGLEAEIGSLEVGKVANLQILTGDPLAATTWVETVLLEGAVAYERAKDPRLQHLFGADAEGQASAGSGR
jgi:imidazolonepropionase-like amidohydrolase